MGAGSLDMNKSEAEFAAYMQELVTDVIETIGGEPAGMLRQPARQ